MTVQETPYINIHSHNANIQGNEIRIINVFGNEFQLPNIQGQKHFFSTGIHPWHINTSTLESDLYTLAKNLKNPLVIALGEAGLDRNTALPLSDQQAVFEQQLSLITQQPKPVIIHCVKAFQEIISIRKNFKNPETWIIHGFNSKIDIARQLLDHDFYLSFGKAVLSNTEKFKEIFSFVPLHRMFFETDDTNINIQDIYADISSKLKMNELSLRLNIYENFVKCFKAEIK